MPPDSSISTVISKKYHCLPDLCLCDRGRHRGPGRIGGGGLVCWGAPSESQW